MGGYGSGGHRDRGARQTHSMMSFDLTWLKKRKLLVPGLTTVQSWSCDGDKIGAVQYTVLHDGLRLTYKFRTGDGGWQDVDETIFFGYSATNFVGRRRWFICPSCQKRCRIIYGGKYFRCRKCYGLTYNSQYQLGWERAASRMTTIIKRMGGFDWEDEFFPKKPKGMHWSTYQKFRDEYDWYNGGRLPTITEWKNF